MDSDLPLRSRACRLIFLGLVVIVLLTTVCWRGLTMPLLLGRESLDLTRFETQELHAPPRAHSHKSTTVDALQDIVLVIKTGATESLRKLPVHFNTTLKHWPNVVLLSDFGEFLEGHQVHDTLDVVSESIREQSPSFDLWRRLRVNGRMSVDEQDPEQSDQIQWIKEPHSDRQEGWRLARFMNLPMAVKAKQFKADAKWYIFIDADTSVSWSNAARLLETLDYTKPLYLGNQVAMGPGEFFGHGGSGYVLSQPALNSVVESYLSEQTRWDTIADAGEFGEVPLARALLNLSIPLTWAFPHFQGGDPDVMDFGATEQGRNLWCYPAITYHHVTREAIEGLTKYEDDWVSRNKPDRPLRHSDVFKECVLPLMNNNRGVDWDNVSNDVSEGISDAAECQTSCLRDERCLQWSWRDGKCRTETGCPKIGRNRRGATSGWVMERIELLVEALDRKCIDGWSV